MDFLSDIKFVLIDIEGTVSDISFVKNVMFPYSYQKLPDYLRAHQGEQEIQEHLATARETLQSEGHQVKDLEDVIQGFLNWIDGDRKHPALKALQGKIWHDGFVNKEFAAPLYPDVLPCWEHWQQNQVRMGIYSSGSVQAQKLFFSHTESGDVTHYLEAHFDLATGSKKESNSYHQIAEQLDLPPGEILFLSDVEAELDAAQEAGMKTIHVVRPGTVPSEQHQTITSFAALV